MKHLFIINPAAGKGEEARWLDGAIRALAWDWEVVRTQRPGDACRLARAAAETEEAVRIYACGGDGTLNEVVNGAAGFPNAAVTNVPVGTGNDFLRIFGPDSKALFSDLRTLGEGPQAAFDLIDCNGKLGIGTVCAGVDARIAADVHKYTSLPLVRGLGGYVLSLVANVLFKGIARPMAVRMGELDYRGETAIICVCNGRYYGGGFMPVGEAMPDDGVLDMLVAPKVSRLTFFRLVKRYASGRYREYPELIWDHHGQKLTYASLDGRDVVTVVDGEVMRAPAFTVTLARQQVNFFYPAGASYQPQSRAVQAEAVL
ncbi:MAG TPA: BmrU protein [Candidatus Enterenecus merdae]|nr:BmrU protein [Candidatus Enterenecus merdae]